MDGKRSESRPSRVPAKRGVIRSRGFNRKRDLISRGRGIARRAGTLSVQPPKVKIDLQGGGYGTWVKIFNGDQIELEAAGKQATGNTSTTPTSQESSGHLSGASSQKNMSQKSGSHGTGIVPQRQVTAPRRQLSTHHGPLQRSGASPLETPTPARHQIHRSHQRNHTTITTHETSQTFAVQNSNASGMKVSPTLQQQSRPQHGVLQSNGTSPFTTSTPAGRHIQSGHQRNQTAVTTHKTSQTLAVQNSNASGTKVVSAAVQSATRHTNQTTREKYVPPTTDQLKKRLVETEANSAKLRMQIQELQRQQNNKDGTIKILRQKIVQKESEAHRLQDSLLKLKQQESQQSNNSPNSSTSMECNNLRAELGFAKRENLEVTDRNRKLLRENQTLKAQLANPSKRPRLELDQGKRSGMPGLKDPNARELNNSQKKTKHSDPFSVHHQPTQHNKAIVMLLEECIEDVLVLLRYDGNSGVEEMPINSLGSSPTNHPSVAEAAFHPSTPPPNAERGTKFQFFETAIGPSKRAGALSQTHSPNFFVDKRAGMEKQLMSNFTPTVNRHRLSKSVPSPFSFALSCKPADNTPTGNRDSGWMLAMKLYRCLFRILNGVTTLSSLLEAVSAYLDPQLHPPIQVQISTVNILQLILNANPVQIRKLILRTESSEPNRSQPDSPKSRAIKKLSELVSSGRVQISSSSGCLPTVTSQRANGGIASRTTDRLQAASFTAAVFDNCVQMLSSCIREGNLNSRFEEVESETSDFSVRLSSASHLMLVHPLLQFFLTLSCVHVGEKELLEEPFVNLIKSGLLRKFLSVLLHERTAGGNDTISNDEKQKFRTYALECASQALELVSTLTQRSAPFSTRSVHCEDFFHSALPPDLFHLVFSSCRPATSTSALQRLESSLLKLCFAYLSYGSQGVDLLLRHNSGSSPENMLVKCLIRFLYRKVSPGISDSRVDYLGGDFSLVQQAFSLLLVLLRATSETPEGTLDLMYGAKVSTADVQLLTSALVHLKEMGMDPALKEVAQKSKELLSNMI